MMILQRLPHLRFNAPPIMRFCSDKGNDNDNNNDKEKEKQEKIKRIQEKIKK